MLAEVDVLAPCALGGVLDEATIPALRCQIVCGAANNQLAREDLADDLHRRGIIYAPDFIANAGGIIHAAEEHAGEHDPDRVARRVEGIHDVIAEILDESEASGRTPLTAAYEIAGRRPGGRAGDRPGLTWPGRARRDAPARDTMGDLLRRSALRDPDKTAIVYGELRQTLRRARRDRQPHRQRAGRARRAQGRPAGAAVAQLARVRRRLLALGPARRDHGPDQLHARRRRGAYILEHSGRERDDRRGRARRRSPSRRSRPPQAVAVRAVIGARPPTAGSRSTR